MFIVIDTLKLHVIGSHDNARGKRTGRVVLTDPLWVNALHRINDLTSENDISNYQTSITKHSGCLFTLVFRFSKYKIDQL